MLDPHHSSLQASRNVVLIFYVEENLLSESNRYTECELQSDSGARHGRNISWIRGSKMLDCRGSYSRDILESLKLKMHKRKLNIFQWSVSSGNGLADLVAPLPRGSISH